MPIKAFKGHPCAVNPGDISHWKLQPVQSQGFQREPPALSTPVHTQKASSFVISPLHPGLYENKQSIKGVNYLTCPTTSKENQSNQCIRNHLCGCQRDPSIKKEACSSVTCLLKFQDLYTFVDCTVDTEDFF